MKRKRQLLRAKLSNMLLNLDTAISFHLHFKAHKFEKSDAKDGGGRKRGQRNTKGKQKSIWFSFGLVPRTSAVVGSRGLKLQTCGLVPRHILSSQQETKDLQTRINTSDCTSQIRQVEAWVNRFMSHRVHRSLFPQPYAPGTAWSLLPTLKVYLALERP